MNDNLIFRLCGTGFIVVALYFLVFKQIVMPIVGVTKPGVVVGFKTKGIRAMSDGNSTSALLVNAKKPYARFVPTGAKDSITVVSDGDPIFGFLNFEKYDHVTVAYWSDANPRTATIISWRMYPVFIAFILIGCLLWWMSFNK
jgi:hypothetical protein